MGRGTPPVPPGGVGSSFETMQSWSVSGSGKGSGKAGASNSIGAGGNYGPNTKNYAASYSFAGFTQTLAANYAAVPPALPSSAQPSLGRAVGVAEHSTLSNYNIDGGTQSQSKSNMNSLIKTNARQVGAVPSGNSNSMLTRGASLEGEIEVLRNHVK